MYFRVVPEKNNFKKRIALIMSEEKRFARRDEDKCVKCMRGHADNTSSRDFATEKTNIMIEILRIMFIIQNIIFYYVDEI